MIEQMLKAAKPLVCGREDCRHKPEAHADPIMDRPPGRCRVTGCRCPVWVSPHPQEPPQAEQDIAQPDIITLALPPRRVRIIIEVEEPDADAGRPSAEAADEPRAE